MMKRLFLIVLVTLISSLLFACDEIPMSSDPLTNDPITDPSIFHLESQTLIGRWVLNESHLNYETYDDFLAFMTFYESKNSYPAYALDGFLDIYDDTFFETNDLIILMIPEHIAISVELSEIILDDQGLSVHVTHQFPDLYPQADTHIVYYSAIAIDKSLHAVDDIHISHQMHPYQDDDYQFYLFQEYGYDDALTDYYHHIFNIESYAELDAFYQSIDHLFMTPQDFCDLGQILSCMAYGYPRLDQLIASYDETFFETHMLLLIPMMEGSGSIRHRIKDITATDNELLVHITKIIPGIGTADMKGWLMVIEYTKPSTPYASYAVEFSSA